MMKATVSFLLFLISSCAYGQMFHSYNASFESGVPGSVPAGWVISRQSLDDGYTAVVINSDATDGRQSVLLSRTKSKTEADSVEEKQSGTFMQKIKADNYRGHTVRLSAMIRTEFPADDLTMKSYLWLDYTNNYRETGQIAYSQHDMLYSDDWKYCAVECVLTNTVEMLKYGVVLNGDGKVWIDDVKLEIIKDYDESTFVPSGAMNDMQVDNISAFINAYGYVRYWYPGFDTYKEEWANVAVNGIEYVSGAGNPEELAQRLNHVFMPIAPAFYASSVKKPKSRVAPGMAKALPYTAYYMFHAGPDINEPRYFYSDIKNLYTSLRKSHGYMQQAINAEELKNKKVTFNVRYKLEAYNTSGLGRLGAIISREGHSEKKLYSDFIQPSKKWQSFKWTIDVPEDAVAIIFELGLSGEGRIKYDELKASVTGGGQIDFRNPGFEENPGQKIIKGWTEGDKSLEAGYTYSIAKDAGANGKNCLIIDTDKATMVPLPDKDEEMKLSMPGGVKITIPLVLEADAQGTVPHRDSSFSMPIVKPEGFVPDIKDRSSRLAIICIAWNLYKHFSPYPGEEKTYQSALKKAIKAAATTEGIKEFTDILNAMIAQTGEAQGRIWNTKQEALFAAPFQWELIDGKLFVIATDNSSELEAGMEVSAINGKPIFEAIGDEAKYITAATNESRTLAALERLRLGPQGSNLILTISDGSDTQELTVIRNSNPSALVPLPPDRFSAMNDSVFYVNLTQMNEFALKKVILRMQYAHAIIFDVRGFTGANHEFLGLFMDSTATATSRLLPVKSGPEHLYHQPFHRLLTMKNPHIACKVYFLTDERTIGESAEIVALAKYYGIGTIVGRPSSGAYGPVFGFGLPAEFNMSLPAYKISMPDGEDIYGKPVKPDVPVRRTMSDIENGNQDIILNKAIELIYSVE